MAELSRKGHRQRVKTSYLNNSFNSMPDHNVLELILFFAIPQKDVKPLAYDLINRFGSLNNVMNANVEDLMKVKGIGENAAILISLFKNVNTRLNQNSAKVEYSSFEMLEEYASHMLRSYSSEVFLVVSFDNGNSIINTHIISDGAVNRVSLSKKTIAEIAIRDRAAKILIAHNHPNGDATPSAADISMTQELSTFIRQIGVKLIDHVIVGTGGETQSLKGDIKYAKYFDE